ncbi:MAG: ABC transporter ATP-binding protein [Egibacteraceae bacterium]
MRHKSGWALLARHLAARRRALAHVAVWSLVESLPALTSGILIATALDRGFLARRPLVGLGWLILLGVTLVVRAFGTRRLYPWLGETVEPLRDALARDLVTAAIARGQTQARQPDTAGVAQLTQQVQAVRELVAALLRTMREVGFTLLASLVGIAALAPSIALVVAPPLLMALALYALLLRPLSTRQRSKLLAGEAITEHAGQVLIGLRDVVACGAEHRAAAAVGGAIDQEARVGRSLAGVGAVHGLVLAVGTQLPVLTVLLAAPWLIQRQHLSVGVVSGAIVYLTTSLGPALGSFAQVAGSWGLQLAVVLQRLAEACAPPLVSPPPPAAPLDRPDGHDLEVRNLTFAYSAHAEPVVRNLSLRLDDGTHLAIVGPSGVGKSTLANLLAGLLPPQHGQVRLNGLPLQHVNDAYLRQTIALIPQEAYLFAGTLRDNLVYLHPDPPEGKLDEAVEAVGLRPTVQRLGGYDALIGPDGATLSEGERQLVALARVYLSPAAIVLLDEATCHLDPAAEAVAEQAFAARGGILIVIAHRISSALRADQILLMDGAAPLSGTHKSLLATSPLYADLIGHWHPEQRHPVASPRGHTR